MNAGKKLMGSPSVIRFSRNLTRRAWLEQAGIGFAVFSKLEREGVLRVKAPILISTLDSLRKRLARFSYYKPNY